MFESTIFLSRSMHAKVPSTPLNPLPGAQQKTYQESSSRPLSPRAGSAPGANLTLVLCRTHALLRPLQNTVQALKGAVVGLRQISDRQQKIRGWHDHILLSRFPSRLVQSISSHSAHSRFPHSLKASLWIIRSYSPPLTTTSLALSRSRLYRFPLCSPGC